jgi:small subunit ribosomal protein S21
MQREGLFREMKERRAYEKPSERRVREKAQAISRRAKTKDLSLDRMGMPRTPCVPGGDFPWKG